MKMISTRGKAPSCSFSEAMKQGLAPDGGLYMPDPIPHLEDGFWGTLKDRSIAETGAEIAAAYASEQAEADILRSVTHDAINFDAPLIHLKENLWVLELFHGPTLAFKDFGARFMARAFAALDNGDDDRELLILVATSGDTGSAVAHGFYGVKGTRVCLLYPSGKVSRLQEQQMTTLGGNITALEVDGTFDDCQRLVKSAFSDPELRKERRMSSANSINIARLIPQSFYYAHATGQLQQQFGHRPDALFSVPSGNFGNLTAGLLAEKMGMPTGGFLAATNINDVVPHFLKTGEFTPRPSKETISNAMDVGNPSNFERIQYLFGTSNEEIARHIHGSSFTDAQTRTAISSLYKEIGYVADPHTAVGFLAAESWRTRNREKRPMVILSTAHPAKFGDVVSEQTGEAVTIPERLRVTLDKKKKSLKLKADYSSFREFIRKLPK